MKKYNQVACLATDSDSRRYLTIAELWEYQEKDSSLFKLTSVQLFQNPIKRFEPFVYGVAVEFASPSQKTLAKEKEKSKSKPNSRLLRSSRFWRVRIERVNCKDWSHEEPLTESETRSYVPKILQAVDTLADVVQRVSKKRARKVLARFAVFDPRTAEGPEPEAWLVGCDTIELDVGKRPREEKNQSSFSSADWLDSGKVGWPHPQNRYKDDYRTNFLPSKKDHNKFAELRRRTACGPRTSPHSRNQLARFHSVSRPRENEVAPPLLVKNARRDIGNARSHQEEKLYLSPQKRARSSRNTRSEGLLLPSGKRYRENEAKPGFGLPGAETAIKISPLKGLNPRTSLALLLPKKTPSAIEKGATIARNKSLGHYGQKIGGLRRGGYGKSRVAKWDTGDNVSMLESSVESYCRKMTISTKIAGCRRMSRSSLGTKTGKTAQDGPDYGEDQGTGSLFRPVFNVMIKKPARQNAMHVTELCAATRFPPRRSVARNKIDTMSWLQQ